MKWKIYEEMNASEHVIIDELDVTMKPNKYEWRNKKTNQIVVVQL